MLAPLPLANRTPDDSAYVCSRNVYHGGMWQPFRVYEMAALKAGNVIDGPAIIRDPMTTVVIPPKRTMSFDQYRILHYK